MQAAFHAWVCTTLRYNQLRKKFVRLAARARMRKLRSVILGWSAFAGVRQKAAHAASVDCRLRLIRWCWEMWRLGARQEKARKQRLLRARAHFKSRR